MAKSIFSPFFLLFSSYFLLLLAISQLLKLHIEAWLPLRVRGKPVCLVSVFEKIQKEGTLQSISLGYFRLVLAVPAIYYPNELEW